MMREQLRQLKTGPTELRRFGLWVGGVLVGLGWLCVWREKSWHAWLWIPGLLLMLSGGIRPQVLRWIYMGWMTVGLALGNVVSTILLTVIYFVVVTPLGLLARCLGRDFLEQKWKAPAITYWHLRDPDRKHRPQDYERQF